MRSAPSAEYLYRIALQESPRERIKWGGPRSARNHGGSSRGVIGPLAPAPSSRSIGCVYGDRGSRLRLLISACIVDGFRNCFFPEVIWRLVVWENECGDWEHGRGADGSAKLFFVSNGGLIVEKDGVKMIVDEFIGMFLVFNVRVSSLTLKRRPSRMSFCKESRKRTYVSKFWYYEKLANKLFPLLKVLKKWRKDLRNK